MTLIRYEPFSLVGRLHRELDHVFNTAEAAGSQAPGIAWIPRVDVHEEPERFVVLADVPGVESKDIDITAEKGVLTLRGERRSHQSTTAKGFERAERVSGTFLRRFTLPETANTETITAKQVNGVLEISIPKHAQVQPRRIAVEAA